MSQVWGREETYRWPSDKPVWTITVLVLAVVAAVGAAVYQYQREWTFFERLYLKTYISAEMRPWLKSAPYPMLYRVEGKQKRAAVEQDLSDPAVLSGGKAKLEWDRGVYNNRELTQWLEAAIYGGDSPWQKLWDGMWKVGAGVLLIGLVFALPRDYQRRCVRKYGRRTKGPELATAAQFNGANRQSTNGIGFITKERRTLGEFLFAAARQDGARATRAGKLALPDDGRHGRGQIIADPADPHAGGRARRDGDRVRSGARIHAAILRAGARGCDLKSGGRANAILVAMRRSAARSGSRRTGGCVVQRRSAHQSVFRDGAPANLRALADRTAEAHAARTAGHLARRARAGEAAEGHRARGSDLSRRRPAARRNDRHSQQRIERAEAAAAQRRSENELDGARMGEAPARMAVHHQPARVPRATAATGQHVARHAGAAFDEPGPAGCASGVVHPGRVAKATGTGKTTLLNALANEIPDDERIFLIEDTAEIRLRKPHVISSESQSNTHKQEISFDALLKAALRHRPDRIILGEVRGPEARTLLDAMNTGHDGTLTTIHASSTEGALKRLAALAVRASGQMTLRDAEEETRQSIRVVLQMARRGGQRTIIAIQA